MKPTIAVVAALTLMSTPLVATAGDDNDCMITIHEWETYPADGDTDVPLNPILVTSAVTTESDSFEVLEDEDGVEVPTSVAFEITWGYCEYVVYRPSADLEPNTTYTMRYDSYPAQANTFTTGETVDDVPPEVEVTEQEHTNTYSSNEPLVLEVYRSEMEFGDVGWIWPGSQTGEVPLCCDATLCDRAGNSFEIPNPPADENDDGATEQGGQDEGSDGGCRVAGVGSGATGARGLLGLLVALLGW